MAEVQPAEGANNNNNNNIEFADAADEEEHAEYLKHAFGREQIYDIPDGAFDTPPITEDVFTPDLLAMHTTNSKFSAIDDGDDPDRSSLSHLAPPSPPNFEETPIKLANEKVVLSDGNEECDETAPLFVDYDTAVDTDEVPLDFLVSNITFLVGCLCYDVTTAARIISPSWHRDHVHSLTLLELLGATLYIFNSLTSVTGMVKMERTRVAPGPAAANDGRASILDSTGCLKFADISPKTGKLRIGWRMWGIVFFLWGSVLYFWSAILLYLDHEHVIGHVLSYPVTTPRAPLKPVDHSAIANALNFFACALMFASAIVSLMERTWCTRHTRNKHNQRIEEGVIVVSCCFTNCFACKHSPRGGRPEPAPELGWRSRLHRDPNADKSHTVVRCSTAALRACRRVMRYFLGAFECWLPRAGPGGSSSKEQEWEQWAYVPACDFGTWGDVLFFVGSITDLLNTVHDSSVLSVFAPALWTIDAVLYVCQDCLQQQQQRRRRV